MKIKFIKSTWGMTEITLEEKFKSIKNAGFDGVEMGFPENRNDQKKFNDLLKKYNLIFVAQQWSAGKNKKEHIKSFKQQFIQNAKFNPVFVNSHTGADYFSFEENLEILKESYLIANDIGIKLIHETHRGRCLFYPEITSKYLKALPELKLTADFSHWCCVTESMLNNHQYFLNEALKNSDHIHARIGYEEGPQVSDPRAPEWKKHLEIHLSWWKKIIKYHTGNSSDFITITPEFGPPNYMNTLPYTKQPVADLWDINLFIKDFLKQKLKDI